MTNNTGNTDLLAINLPIMRECSRCGEDHENLLLKQLLHPFMVNKEQTYTRFGWIVIDISDNKEEPILVTPETEKFNIIDQEDFTIPMIVEVGDKPRNYTFWSYCPDTFQPIFIELSIEVQEHDNE